MLLSSFTRSHFLYNDTTTTEIYTLSLHDALPISKSGEDGATINGVLYPATDADMAKFQEREKTYVQVEVPISQRSEEHTSELQSLRHLVCRLLLEKKKQSEQKYYYDIDMCE